ncbi:MAG: DUF6883 domain-containing protein [Thermodesulfobacteriota bacterium]|jgi:hypothetical protein
MPVKLPSDTVIAPEKLTRYLLVKRTFDDKSQSLRQAGYTLDNWEQLEQDLRLQVLPYETTLIERTVYGNIFEIRSSLTGPNGKLLFVNTIWMNKFRSGATKFITL